MNLRQAKALVGDRLCFSGYIDAINVIKDGTVEQIRETVRQAILDGAPGGGFIIGNPMAYAMRQWTTCAPTSRRAESSATMTIRPGRLGRRQHVRTYLSSRERLLTTINHEEPDHLPLVFRNVAPLHYLWKNRLERAAALLDMGVDDKIILGMPWTYHPDCSVRRWRVPPGSARACRIMPSWAKRSLRLVVPCACWCARPQTTCRRICR